jgi:hypothetical protein
MDENLPNVIYIHVEYWIIFQEKKVFLVDEFFKRFNNGNFSVSITIYWPSQIRLKYVIQLIILNVNNTSLKYDFECNFVHICVCVSFSMFFFHVMNQYDLGQILYISCHYSYFHIWMWLSLCLNLNVVIFMDVRWWRGISKLNDMKY